MRFADPSRISLTPVSLPGGVRGCCRGEGEELWTRHASACHGLGDELDELAGFTNDVAGACSRLTAPDGVSMVFLVISLSFSAQLVKAIRLG